MTTPDRQDDGLRDFARRCQAYLDDAPADGRHSDAAGSNAYELIQEAIEHYTPPSRDAAEGAEETDEFGYFDLGRSFYEEFTRLSNDGNFKGFICGCSPVEILVHLINERDEALAPVPPADALRQNADRAHDKLYGFASVPPADGARRHLKSSEERLVRSALAGSGTMIEELPSPAVLAEPVAWRWRYGTGLSWCCTTHRLSLRDAARQEPRFEEQPLYAAAPVRGDREALAQARYANGKYDLREVLRAGFREMRFVHPDIAADDMIDAIISLPVQPGAGERGSDAAEADRYFDMAGEFGNQLQTLAGVVQDAVDILAERKHGNAARSSGHNARVILQTALKKVSPSALPSRQAPHSSREEK